MTGWKKKKNKSASLNQQIELGDTCISCYYNIGIKLMYESLLKTGKFQ